jgi:hypothetical protein
MPEHDVTSKKYRRLRPWLWSRSFVARSYLFGNDALQATQLYQSSPWAEGPRHDNQILAFLRPYFRAVGEGVI